MAKDIKLFKDNIEVIINECNLEYYLKLGYKEQENKTKFKKETKWQHITEKKE
jgi:hypothetical protein